MHRYAYCGNDPVNYVDPMGTNPVYATINGGGGGSSSLGKRYQPELPRLGPMWEVPDLGYTGKAPKPDPKPPAPKTSGTSGTKTNQKTNSTGKPENNSVDTISGASSSTLTSSDIFGAEYSVGYQQSVEIMNLSPLNSQLVGIRAGTTKTIIEQQRGDSSKPISVYARNDANWTKSSAGIKLNIWRINISSNLSLSDTSLQIGYRSDEKLYTAGVSASLDSILQPDVAVGYRVTTFETNQTEYGEAYLNLWVGLALAYYLSTSDVSVFDLFKKRDPAYP